jgi:hypothetical protein
VLVTDGVTYLNDWEEFRLGDPARDVGGFAGEWLYRAVLGLPPETDDRLTPVVEATDAEIVERGVRELTRLRPRIRSFWSGYRTARPTVDPELAERATAFAGWHLLDRLFAVAVERPRLLAVQRAAAGVGRTALLAPDRFTTTLGLEG